MGKSITPLTIDEDIKKRAKEMNLNMSGIAEEAIRDKVKFKEKMGEVSPRSCAWCGSEIKIATKEDLNGLMWISPEERWICPSCLTYFSRNITK